MKSIALRLALLTLGTIASLFVGELLVRVAFRDLSTMNDGRSYFNHRWRARSVRLNRLGFWERDLSREKKPGVYRLAVIGDSITFGQGLKAFDRFTNVLAERLESHGVEVMNFGESGADTADELRTLKRVLAFEPDFVLLQWFPNDFQGHAVRPRFSPVTEQWYGPVHAKLVAVSALYALTNLAAQRLIGVDDDYPRYMAAAFGDESSAASRAEVEVLRQFIATCRDARVRMGMLLVPALVSPAGDYPFAFLHERVLKLCADEEIVCVDVRGSLPQVDDPTALWVTRLDPHPGADVNRAMADELLRVFGEEWNGRTR